MRALLFLHADHEGAGLIGEALALRKIDVDRRSLHRGDSLPESSAGYDLVIAMGGPQSAWDDKCWPFLAREADLLAEATRAGRLTLGICLGAQLLARGLGGRVFKGPQSEIGIAPISLDDAGWQDPLLRRFDGQNVLHWHNDTFGLPEGAVRLASSDLYAHQAFRVGARAWGIQFHVECDEAMRREWARLGHDDLVTAGIDPATLTGPATRGMDDRGRAFATALVAHL
jgi:GMP synthase (glutamine-hydrolysing)